MERDEPPLPPEARVLTAEDIEAAYERALQALEAVEVAVADFGEAACVADTAAGDDPSRPTSETDVGPRLPADQRPEAGLAEADAPVLHPREIMEAALFVGGQHLTTKRLAQMLGSDYSAEQVDADIAGLNDRYRSERRPYRIDFGAGGYRLVLLPEFEGVRASVFGAAPREIKLSQDALEALAFVAYRQPIGVADLEEAGKVKAAGLLRELLRRQLIALNRSENGDVTYSTTPRFLDVFGLRSLDDLPFPEDLELK